jgi:microsomal dipeptidase-like Zn-dependent dipeptidase
MNMGMMIDVDHMSITAFNNTIGLANQQNPKYGGIAATHVQFFDFYTKTYAGTSNGDRHERMRTASQLQSLKNLGGVIAVMLKDDVQDTSMGWCLPGVSLLTCAPSPLGPGPIGGQFTIDYGGLTNDCMYSTKEWAQAYLYGVNAMGGPVAMGSDFNGIAGHVGPRFGSGSCGGNWAERTRQEAANNRLVYPFTLPGFGTFDKQVSGQRTFDFNNDGLAHIGLLPDMVADLQNVGLTDQQLQPLFGGAQAYINSWSLVAHVPPQITSANTATFPAATAGTTFTVIATGNPAPTLSVSGALPGGVTFNSTTGVFSGTPGSNTQGNYPLTITASNGNLPNATQNFTLVVGPTPAFTNDPSAIVFVGFNRTVSFTSPLLTTIFLDGTLPQALTFNSPIASGTGTLSGIPSIGTGGVYPLTEETKFGIIVTNSQPFILYVYEAPVITSTNSLDTSVGASVSLQVAATGYPVPTFSFAGTLPKGVDFDSTKGRFFGTPGRHRWCLYGIRPCL